jgi:hypothetical protein
MARKRRDQPGAPMGNRIDDLLAKIHDRLRHEAEHAEAAHSPVPTGAATHRPASLLSDYSAPTDTKRKLLEIGREVWGYRQAVMEADFAKAKPAARNRARAGADAPQPRSKLNAVKAAVAAVQAEHKNLPEGQLRGKVRILLDRSGVLVAESTLGKHLGKLRPTK